MYTKSRQHAGQKEHKVEVTKIVNNSLL